MKKTLSFALAVIFALSFTTVAFAASSNGKGVAAAPGQADNFSKGITTEVTFSVEVSTPHVAIETYTATKTRLKDTILNKVIGTPIVTDTDVDYTKIVDTIAHNQHDWVAYLYPTTVTAKAIATNTQIDTFASYEVNYERTVSTYYLIKRTIQHQGAPNSNGKVISDVSEEIVTRVVRGDWTEVSLTEIPNTTYTTETQLPNTEVITTTFTTTKSAGWFRADGSPATESQAGGAKPASGGGNN